MPEGRGGSEILAPAGSPRQLEAACRAGADAVYLGAGLFNARRGADNFSGDALDEAVRSCHRRGVKAYLAMNTLIFDREFAPSPNSAQQEPDGYAINLIKKACDLAVDAIIAQDLGLCACIRETAPDMPIHASTQMNIQNPAALPLLKSMGVSRVILPRELSLGEIGQMCAAARETGMETEVFVHGALCMSVSGQCYFSAVLGGRSGNRGLCAQPCRLPFSGSGLSLKDMSYLSHLKTLAGIGVDSFKIEGRMKRPEYAACAVAACRRALEGTLPPELEEQLRQVFSRGGFTDGYLTGKRGADMFGKRADGDALPPNSPVYSSLHALYKNEYQRVPVDFAVDFDGDTITLTARDDSGNVAVVECGDPIAPAPAMPPIPPDMAAEKLRKCGGTPYFPRNIHVGGSLPLRAAQINALRREALEKLSRLREYPPPVGFAGGGLSDPPPVPYRPAVREFRAVFASHEQLPDEIPDEIARIYIPLETPAHTLRNLVDKYGGRLCLEAPRGVFGREDEIRGLLDSARGIGIKECMVHTLGLIPPVKEAGITPYGGFGLNLTNTRALRVMGSLGLSGAELSLELTEKQVGGLSGDLARGVTVYGRAAVMLTRNCPVSAAEYGKNGMNWQIIDRLGKPFFVRCRFGCAEVFNCIPTSIVENLSGIPPIDHCFIRFSVENSVETVEILDGILSGSTNRNNGLTRGLWKRGVL
ncbi:MAG: U32 family peptidase [Oscillospiraceae bacterium]|nr:U32 family peptidase [Oscillospiraceae bacterium]